MKNKVKKIAILIIVIFLLIVINGYFGIDRKLGQMKINLIPSEEMKILKKIEDSFNLPEPLRRYANDDGYNTDWKGARHYTRYIHITYNNKDLINIAKEKVENTGWTLDKTSKYLEEVTYRYTEDIFQTSDYKIDLSITIDSSLSKGNHHIWIKSRINK